MTRETKTESRARKDQSQNRVHITRGKIIKTNIGASVTARDRENPVTRNQSQVKRMRLTIAKGKAQETGQVDRQDPKTPGGQSGKNKRAGESSSERNRQDNLAK